MKLIIGDFGPILGGAEHGHCGQVIKILFTRAEAEVYAHEMARSYKPDGAPDTAKMIRVLVDALRSMVENVTTPSLVLPVSSIPADEFNQLFRMPLKK